MRSLAWAVVAALGLASCAWTRTRNDDLFEALKFPDTQPAPFPLQPTDKRHADAFEIEVIVADDGGRTLAKSRLTGGPGRLVIASNMRRTPYVHDYECGWNGFPPPRPIVHFVDVGTRIEACVQRDAEGRLSISWRARMSKLNLPVADFRTTLAIGPPIYIQMPEETVTTAEGLNPIEAGAATSLGRIRRPDGSGWVQLSARIVEVLVDASEIGAFEVAPAALVSVDAD